MATRAANLQLHQDPSERRGSEPIRHGMRCADRHVAEEAEAMGASLAAGLHQSFRSSQGPSMMPRRPARREEGNAC
eukprot:748822-Hanusia_phi.AAC.3